MQPSPLRYILNSFIAYGYDPVVEVDDPDVCLICRDPYVPQGSADGCRSIRLHACGHMIGDRCFGNWIQHHIGSCPYWNHPLPSHTTITQPGIRLLFRICQTHWFSFQEDGLAHTINGLGIQTEHYGNRLRNGTMTIKDGFRLLAETLLAHMIMCLQIVIFSLIVELWPLLGSMWRYGVDGSWKFTSTGFPSFVLSVMITNFVAFGMVVILLLMVMVRKE